MIKKNRMNTFMLFKNKYLGKKKFNSKINYQKKNISRSRLRLILKPKKIFIQKLKTKLIQKPRLIQIQRKKSNDRSTMKPNYNYKITKKKLVNPGNIKNNSPSPIINENIIVDPNHPFYIPHYIPARKDIPIRNSYEIYNNKYKDEFHIVVYYLTENSAKVIVRRMDSESGWGQNLSIIINNLTDSLTDFSSEIFVIGPSVNNYCEKEIIANNILFTPIDLSYEQCIPKRIVQTTKIHMMQNPLHYNSVMTFLELNPEYEYYLFDDCEARDFIRDHFPLYVFQAYDMLIPGAYKADLFRYCYLYICGGCYFDCKMVLFAPLREMILPDENIFLCYDSNEKHLTTIYYNAIMGFVPNNPELFDTIDKSCYYIHNKIYRSILNYKNFDYLSITGPYLLGEVFNQLNIIPRYKMDNGIIRKYPYSNQESKIYLKTIYMNHQNYYNNYSKFYHKQHYRTLYDQKNIYHSISYNHEFRLPTKIVLNKFDILPNYPRQINKHSKINNQPNHFTIILYYINQNTCLAKIYFSAENGWTNNLQLKIYSIDQSQSHIIAIGPSSNSQLFIEFPIHIPLQEMDISIPHYIDKRNDIAIINKYEIQNNHTPSRDFHIVLYYFDKNSIKGVIRNIHSNFGWNENLEILLYSVDHSTFEKIIIPPCNINYYIFEKSTSIDIIHLDPDYQQSIPKVIVQSTLTRNIPTLSLYNSIMTFIELNPEYEYYLFDHDECREFIRNNMPEYVLNTYDKLIPGAYKSDLFRACYLYIHGGCYFDCKTIMYYPLRNLILPNEQYLFVYDVHKDVIYCNAYMLLTANNPDLLRMIHQSCYYTSNNIYRLNIPHNALSITGPYIFREFFKNYRPKYYFLRTSNNANTDYIYQKDNTKSTKMWKRLFNNYYIDYKLFSNGKSYSILYKEKDIYDTTIKFICPIDIKNNYTQFIKNTYHIIHNKFKDTFAINVYYVNDHYIYVQIRRTDSNSGWGQNVRIKLYSINKKEYDIIEIGKSKYNSCNCIVRTKISVK
jgi:mannosyltransferase OCH1-like enzyme